MMVLCISASSHITEHIFAIKGNKSLFRICLDYQDFFNPTVSVCYLHQQAQVGTLQNTHKERGWMNNDGDGVVMLSSLYSHHVRRAFEMYIRRYTSTIGMRECVVEYNANPGSLARRVLVISKRL